MIIVLKRKHLILISLALAVLLLAMIPANSYLQTLAQEKQEGQKLPILMYHHITEKPELAGKYTVLVSELEQDLIYLKQHGYHSITMTQLIDHVKKGTELPPKPIIITFDDGQESFYAYAYPLLQKLEMCAIMSIVGSYTDQYSEIDDHHIKYSYLNWEEVKELSQSGFVEIQNHTYNMHSTNGSRMGCRIKKGESDKQYEQALWNDVGKLQEQIYEYTGIHPNTFTYPYGYICNEATDILKKMGFEAALTCAEKVNIIREGENTDWLYSLGRFNRPHGESTSSYIARATGNK